MCGIAGIFSFQADAPPIDAGELEAIRDHMAPRGPDGAGSWISDDGRIGLAHRRLAIIDLSDNAAQPMEIEDGRYRITFNGEIYNYRALRDELTAQGVQFKTQSDTEVVLQLYARHGSDVVSKLRGMFSFAIWMRPNAVCSPPATRWASSRFIIPTMAGRFASPRRSRP